MAALGQNTLDLFMFSLISVASTYTQEQSPDFKGLCWVRKHFPPATEVGATSGAHSGLPDSVTVADGPRALGW